MALNLGNEAMEAAKTLHQHGDSQKAFEAVRAGILEQVRKHMNLALDVAPDDRHAAVGYARALRDVYMALESSAHNGAQQVRAEQPGPVKNNAAR